MRRFFYNGIIDNRVVLSGDEHKHLTTVLRFGVNRHVTLFNGDGFDYCGIIKDTNKTNTVINIISRCQNIADPTVKLDLYFGVLKSNDKVEMIVQKAVELGVNKIIPFTSTNSVAKSINCDRLNKISIEALKQCGRSALVNVSEIVKFDTLIEKMQKYDKVYFAYEKQNTDSGNFIINENTKTFKNIAIVVGCEGGFTKLEVEEFYKCYISPISLGNRILRAETACIALISIIMHFYNQMSNNK